MFALRDGPWATVGRLSYTTASANLTLWVPMKQYCEGVSPTFPERECADLPEGRASYLGRNRGGFEKVTPALCRLKVAAIGED